MIEAQLRRETDLLLSIFPGIDGLGRAFEALGCCVVRGPDVLCGGDVRTFHPPRGVFRGVIGGDPCQAHSKLNWINRARGISPKFPDMTGEFARVVAEAYPLWFLRENVPYAPDIEVPGYETQRIRLNNRWFGEIQNRERIFWFGSRCPWAKPLLIEFAVFEHPETEMAIISSRGWIKRNGRREKSPESVARNKANRALSIQRCCELQGFPPDLLDDAPFTMAGKRRVVGGMVPFSMGLALAKAIRNAMANQALGGDAP